MASVATAVEIPLEASESPVMPMQANAQDFSATRRVAKTTKKKIVRCISAAHVAWLVLGSFAVLAALVTVLEGLCWSINPTPSKHAIGEFQKPLRIVMTCEGMGRQLENLQAIIRAYKVRMGAAPVKIVAWPNTCTSHYHSRTMCAFDYVTFEGIQGSCERFDVSKCRVEKSSMLMGPSWYASETKIAWDVVAAKPAWTFSDRSDPIPLCLILSFMSGGEDWRESPHRLTLTNKLFLTAMHFRAILFGSQPYVAMHWRAGDHGPRCDTPGLAPGSRCKATGVAVVQTIHKHLSHLRHHGRANGTHFGVYVMTNEVNQNHLQLVMRAGFKTFGDVPSALRKGFLDEEVLMIELQLVAMASHFIDKHANTLVSALIKPMGDHIASFSRNDSSRPGITAMKSLHEARSAMFALLMNNSVLSAHGIGS